MSEGWTPQCGFSRKAYDVAVRSNQKYREPYKKAHGPSATSHINAADETPVLRKPLVPSQKATPKPKPVSTSLIGQFPPSVQKAMPKPNPVPTSLIVQFPPSVSVAQRRLASAISNSSGSKSRYGKHTTVDVEPSAKVARF